MGKKKPAPTPSFDVIAQIEKQFGDGTIQTIDQRPVADIETISTGSLTLDMALGVLGFPRGRIIEVFGPESSGKTTLALHVMAQATKQKQWVAMVDVEHAYDPAWARRIGVDSDYFHISQPDCGEDAMQIVEMLIKAQHHAVIVVDSVAALVPRAELEGEIGDAHVGLQARLMSQSMRKITGAIHKSNCIVVFINQIRDKIGVMFGSPETTPGGRALKFYSSVRVDIRKLGQVKVGEDIIGQRIRAKVVKNKVAPPFKVAEFDLLFSSGFNYAGEVLDLALASKIVTRSGSWFKYGDTHLGQGREKSCENLRENPGLMEELKKQITETCEPQECEPE